MRTFQEEVNELFKNLEIIGRELAKTPPFSWYMRLAYTILDRLTWLIERIIHARSHDSRL